MTRRLEQISALEAEFRSEQAATLKAEAKKLVECLTRLSDCTDQAERPSLLAQARERTWKFVIQRELMGLSQIERALDFYKVPTEVRAHMGPQRSG